MRSIERYLDEQGRIKRWPKRGKLPLLLAWLAARFEPDRGYSEKEVNGLLDSLHEFTDPSFRRYRDAALLRRELVDYGYLVRDEYGATYRRASHEESPTIPADRLCDTVR